MAEVVKNNIKEHRKKKGLLQRELAKIVGIGRIAMGEHERHKYNISPRLWKRYAKALGIAVGELFEF